MRLPRPSASAVFAILMLLSFMGLFLPPDCTSGFRSALHSFIAPSALGANHLLRYFAPQPPSPSMVDAEQLAQLYDHLKQLQRQNIYLHTRWMEAVDQYAQAQHLRKSLLLEQYSLVPANVYSYGSTPGRAIMSIDQGSAAGLQKGYWVVGLPQGVSAATGWETLARAVLVGRIAEVELYTSQVRLIGDPDDYVGPKILAHLYRRTPGGPTEGWTKGENFQVEPLPGGLLLARDVPKKNADGFQSLPADLIGLPVVSAAMKNLPAGLGLGRVLRVSDSTSSMAFWDLTIEPLAGRSRLHSVMVLCPLWPEGR